MKTVIVRRLKDGVVIEEKFHGRDVNWAFDENIFRVWDTYKTNAYPYDKIESIEISHLNV